MIVCCDSHSAMFSPTNRHVTQPASFNPYSYGTPYPTQAQGHYSGTQMANMDLASLGTQDQSYQQGAMPWHSAHVYPTSAKPASYEDWGQAQGSPPSASSCTHNQAPLNLIPTTNPTIPTTYGYGQSYQQYRQINNSPAPEYVGMPGPSAISDVHHLSPDTTLTVSSDPDSPGVISPVASATSVRPQPARSPYEWMKRQSYQNQQNPGKTRTKDKYRVVYTDHQRLELEKEFHYSRYITIRRKSELASLLGLSERQVKIWFQNRRAKERKQVKKQEEIVQKEKDQVRQHLHVTSSPLASIGKPLVSIETGQCS